MPRWFARLLHRPIPRRAVQESRERGSSSVEFAMMIPLLITLLLTLMQCTLWYQGRNVLLGAAQEAARAAAQDNGSVSAGRSAATSFISRTNSGMTNVTVTVSKSGTEVTVTVSGKALSVLPGYNQIITQSTSLPVERITR